MKWLPYIPQDKQKHVIVGLGVAALFTLLRFVEQLVLGHAGFSDFMQLHPWFFGIVNAGICVHVAKEGTDWIDNQMMKARGLPPLHGVDPWDAVAGEIGTVALACLLLWLGLV
jgi:hypothetical protein